MNRGKRIGLIFFFHGWVVEEVVVVPLAFSPAQIMRIKQCFAKFT